MLAWRNVQYAAGIGAEFLLRMLQRQAWLVVGYDDSLPVGVENDARAMQSYAALKVIEKTLRKAHRCVDKHDRRYANLFLAYFDLKKKSDESTE